MKKDYLQRKVWNSHKIKEFNKLNHKTVTLHCYCGDSIKFGFLSKTLVSVKATICHLRKCQTTRFCDKCLLVITWNKKKSSKQFVSYAMDKNVFRCCYFWHIVSCFNSDEVKKPKYTLVSISVLCISIAETIK